MSIKLSNVNVTETTGTFARETKRGVYATEDGEVVITFHKNGSADVNGIPAHIHRTKDSKYKIFPDDRTVSLDYWLNVVLTKDEDPAIDYIGVNPK